MGKNITLERLYPNRLTLGRSTRAFFGGMATAIDVFGKGDLSEPLRIYISDRGDNEIDADAIRTAWIVVGTDLNDTFTDFEREHPHAPPARLASRREKKYAVTGVSAGT